MKIYNKIVLAWNKETESYDDVVFEDSFEYEGELALAGCVPKYGYPNFCCSNQQSHHCGPNHEHPHDDYTPGFYCRCTGNTNINRMDCDVNYDTAGFPGTPDDPADCAACSLLTPYGQSVCYSAPSRTDWYGCEWESAPPTYEHLACVSDTSCETENCDPPGEECDDDCASDSDCATGACCSGTGCTDDVNAQTCSLFFGTLYPGETCGEECMGSPCYPCEPEGACCGTPGYENEGQCYAPSHEDDCLYTGAEWTWIYGVDCSPNPCDALELGACCANAGGCSDDVTEGHCLGTWYQADTCDDYWPGFPCFDQPPMGACCDGDNCTYVYQQNCDGGLPWTEGETCADNFCIEWGVCCCPGGGGCTYCDDSDCQDMSCCASSATGIPFYRAGTCDDPFPPEGPCGTYQYTHLACDGAGNCQYGDCPEIGDPCSDTCSSQGDGVPYCAGACCGNNPDLCVEEYSEEACNSNWANTGNWQGFDTMCGVECGNSDDYGACCWGGCDGCSMVWAENQSDWTHNCIDEGGTFQGQGSFCDQGNDGCSYCYYHKECEGAGNNSECVPGHLCSPPQEPCVDDCTDDASCMAPPEANFTYTKVGQINANWYAYTFLDQSIAGSNPIVEWEWSSGEPSGGDNFVPNTWTFNQNYFNYFSDLTLNGSILNFSDHIEDTCVPGGGIPSPCFPGAENNQWEANDAPGWHLRFTGGNGDRTVCLKVTDSAGLNHEYCSGVEMNDEIVLGACCNMETEDCFDEVQQIECTTEGYSWASGLTCDPNPCYNWPEACCEYGQCVDVQTSGDCLGYFIDDQCADVNCNFAPPTAEFTYSQTGNGYNASTLSFTGSVQQSLDLLSFPTYNVYEWDCGGALIYTEDSNASFDLTINNTGPTWEVTPYAYANIPSHCVRLTATQEDLQTVNHDVDINVLYPCDTDTHCVDYNDVDIAMTEGHECLDGFCYLRLVLTEDMSYEIDEDPGEPLTIDLAAGVTNNGATDLSWNILQEIDEGTGSLTCTDNICTYQPPDNWFSPADTPVMFTYQVGGNGTYGYTESLSSTVSITVHSVQDYPTATDIDVEVDENTETDPSSVAITLLGVAGNDATGVPLLYNVISVPTNGLIIGNAASGPDENPDVIYYPNQIEDETHAGYVGPDSFTYQVSDDDGIVWSPEATVSITVNDISYSPEFTSDPGAASDGFVDAPALREYSYTMTASDPDPDDVLTFTAPTLPGWLEFDGIATISGIPGPDLSNQIFDVTLKVTDSYDNFVDQIFQIKVSSTGCMSPSACDWEIYDNHDETMCAYPCAQATFDANGLGCNLINIDINYDCNGNCVATGDNLNENGLDCLDVCAGLAQEDACGLCEGPGAVYACGCYSVSDSEQCDGSGYIGSETPGEYCNCECHVVDECSVCAGPGPEFLCWDGVTVCDESECISQVQGCTDPAAYNHDSEANFDDGSCDYSPATREDVVDRLSQLLIEEFEKISSELGINELPEQQKAISEDGLISIGRDHDTQRLVLYSTDVKANEEDLSIIDDLMSGPPEIMNERLLSMHIVGDPGDYVISISYDGTIITPGGIQTGVYYPILNNISQFIGAHPNLEPISPEKASEVLDTKIRELYRVPESRQKKIDDFFDSYSELKPSRYDVTCLSVVNQDGDPVSYELINSSPHSMEFTCSSNHALTLVAWQFMGEIEITDSQWIANCSDGSSLVLAENPTGEPINAYDQVIYYIEGVTDTSANAACNSLETQEVSEQHLIESGISGGGQYLTWRDEDEDEANIDKSLEWLLEDLSGFFREERFDPQTADYRPRYENASLGYLKVRNLNQFIIVRNEEDDSKILDGWETDGFTITMWVKFLSEVTGGTLFNFGNPLRDIMSTDSDQQWSPNEGPPPHGFMLDTFTRPSSTSHKRYLRLVVREADGKLRDSHFGVSGTQRWKTEMGDFSAYEFMSDTAYFTEVPVRLHEWYFIVATYDPDVIESESEGNLYWPQYGECPEFWNWKIDPTEAETQGECYPNTSNSGYGSKCKVEIISRSELVRARGFKQ